MVIRENNIVINPQIAQMRTPLARERLYTSLLNISKLKKMNEKLLEKKLRESVKKMGGLAVKFSSQTYTGMPDRIILMPGGKTSFAEIKTTGKKPTVLQALQIENLRKLGFKAEVIDSPESLNLFLEGLK